LPGLVLASVLVYLRWKADQEPTDPAARKARLEERIAAAFQQKGYQGGGKPVVTLREVGEGKWEGTARYGDIVYEVSYDEKRPDGFEWRRRYQPVEP
jgi:hypothetical protein